MDSVTKWEYLTAWRYTGMEKEEGMFKKGVPLELLEVREEEPEDFEYKLDELGGHVTDFTRDHWCDCIRDYIHSRVTPIP